MSDACPSPEALRAHLQGEGGDEQARELTRHVERCAACRASTVELLNAGQYAHATQATVTASNAPTSYGPRPAGSQVGRYTVERLLGAGGMGVVYEALDPELDRRIALKVLRRPTGDRERLSREAKAFARLSHPNVVTIHDVGLAGADVFMALELVEGPTLRGWLAEAERSPQATLALLREAGAGLAAAHRAGLVHGDFKPENVLVTRAGTARVTDFGLARLAEPEGVPSGETPPATGPLTVTLRGGTPAYMAPEQLCGGSATPKTDQFAFCVTAYECLFGVRPFAGRAADELFEAAVAGRITRPARRVRLPSRVTRALLRGLDADPARRFPSLEALLAQLAPRAGRRRRVALGGVAAALAVGAAAAFWLREDPCLRGWEGIWDAAQQRQISDAFVRTGAPYAAGAFAQVKRVLDGYTAEWTAAHARACRTAEKLSRAQLPSTEGARAELLCLNQRREDVRTLARSLLAPTPQGVERSSRLDESLIALEGCAALEAVDARPLLPVSAAQRGAVEALQAELAQVRALTQAGRYPEVTPLAQGVLERARALGFRPVEAEALLLMAQLENEERGETAEAERRYYQAALAAEAIRWDAVAARAWIAAGRMVRGTQPALALERYDLAAAAIARSGESAELRSLLLSSRARLHADQGQREEAARQQREAYELAKRTFAPDDPRLARREVAMGISLGMGDQCEAALPLLASAQQTLERVGGPQHPQLLDALTTRGICLQKLSRTDEAVEVLERARAIIEASFGPQSPRLSSALANLSGALSAKGRNEEALASLRRAISLRREALGESHPTLLPLWLDEADLLEKLARPKEAVQRLEHALAVAKQAGGNPQRTAPIVEALGRLRR